MLDLFPKMSGNDCGKLTLDIKQYGILNLFIVVSHVWDGCYVYLK